MSENGQPQRLSRKVPPQAAEPVRAISASAPLVAGDWGMDTLPPQEGGRF